MATAHPTDGVVDLFGVTETQVVDRHPLTVNQVLERIRFDRETKLGSILDVIQLVTGCEAQPACVNIGGVSTRQTCQV